MFQIYTSSKSTGHPRYSKNTPHSSKQNKAVVSSHHRHLSAMFNGDLGLQIQSSAGRLHECFHSCVLSRREGWHGTLACVALRLHPSQQQRMLIQVALTAGPGTKSHADSG